MSGSQAIYGYNQYTRVHTQRWTTYMVDRTIYTLSGKHITLSWLQQKLVEIMIFIINIIMRVMVLHYKLINLLNNQPHQLM